MKIEDIDFSLRSYHCLKHSGVNTIEELTCLTEKDLDKIRNLGGKQKKEIISKIKEIGFEFNK